jgi:hypothetical protein
MHAKVARHALSSVSIPIAPFLSRNCETSPKGVEREKPPLSLSLSLSLGEASINETTRRIAGASPTFN